MYEIHGPGDDLTGTRVARHHLLRVDIPGLDQKDIHVSVGKSIKVQAA
ncbi:MAG TPA: hypothetical protein VGQ77_01330 [Methylomirabilota bacterium]|nr:hypothetical protein [Methylomirabilota bacterium]